MKKHSPWEAKRCSVSQEICSIVWNTEVHYCVRNILLLIPILSQMNPLNTIPSHFFKIHPNIIFPVVSYPSDFLPEACMLFSPMHSKCPIHLILPYLTILLIFGEEYKLWSNFLQPLVTSSLLDPNVLIRTLFAYTLSLSSLNVRNQVLYFYKIIRKNYSPILWCTDPLLGNDSVNTSPQEPTCATIGRLLLGNG
jgi:hypothetical protein